MPNLPESKIKENKILKLDNLIEEALECIDSYDEINFQNLALDVFNLIDELYNFKRRKDRIKSENERIKYQKEIDKSKINKLAEYKGFIYRVEYVGPTRYGRAIKLQFLDKSSSFWAKEESVHIYPEIAPDNIKNKGEAFDYMEQMFGVVHDEYCPYSWEEIFGD